MSKPEFTFYARKCNISGELFNNGFVFDDADADGYGDSYIKSEENAEIHAKSLGYDSYQAAHDEDGAYYTEYDPDNMFDVEYVLVDGKTFHINDLDPNHPAAKEFLTRKIAQCD